MVLHPANVLHHTEINLEKNIKYSKTVKLLHFKRLLQCINYSSHLEIFWVYRENEGIKIQEDLCNDMKSEDRGVYKHVKEH